MGLIATRSHEPLRPVTKILSKNQANHKPPSETPNATQKRLSTKDQGPYTQAHTHTTEHTHTHTEHTNQNPSSANSLQRTLKRNSPGTHNIGTYMRTNGLDVGLTGCRPHLKRCRSCSSSIIRAPVARPSRSSLHCLYGSGHIFDSLLLAVHTSSSFGQPVLHKRSVLTCPVLANRVRFSW